MTGDGEARAVREFLSFGSSVVRNPGGSEERERSGTHSGRQAEYSLPMEMLSSLSRNGLSLLAGGGGAGLSLKPLAVGMPRLRSLARNGASAECGGGYTGFTGYRAARVVRPALQFGRHEEMKVKEEVGTSSHEGPSIGDKVEQTDVQKLTADECWRLTLKLGKKNMALCLCMCFLGTHINRTKILVCFEESFYPTLLDFGCNYCLCVGCCACTVLDASLWVRISCS